jgi:hypothetical protein
MNHLDILNKTQAFLIDQANEKGINLEEHFATVQDFKGFVIAFAFKNLTEAGMAADEAFDAVCGEGKFNEMAEYSFQKANA